MKVVIENAEILLCTKDFITKQGDKFFTFGKQYVCIGDNKFINDLGIDHTLSDYKAISEHFVVF